MNYFAPATAAQRYAKGRPSFHPLVIDRLKAFAGLSTPVARAIDVGCGTGLSTVALKAVAREVVGVDVAPAMLALAPPDPALTFVAAPAEQLPFDDASFDLMTVSSAFHWLNRAKFLADARRVLKPAGWLLVYDYYFLAAMEGQSAFNSWFEEVFMVRYPAPSRNRQPFGPDEARSAGFDWLSQEQYTANANYTIRRLIDYLMSISNITAKIESGAETVEDIEGWLNKALTPLFGNQNAASFAFGGPIWYLRRAT